MTRDTTTRRSLLATLLLLFAAPFGSADDGELCGRCKTTGKITNPNAASTHDNEAGCLFCSVMIDQDPAGVGLDWMPCPDCKATRLKAEAQREFDKLKNERLDWHTKRLAIEKFAGIPMMHCETKHFRFGFTIPKIEIKKVVYDQHRAMHIYAKRAEDLWDKIVALHGITEGEIGGKVKHEVVMFERERDAKVLSPYMTDLALNGGAKAFKIGPEKSAVVSWDDPRYVLDDEDRHQLFVHMIAHHVYHDMAAYKWWLYEKNGWLFESTSDIWEYSMFGSPRVNCSQEQSGGPLNLSHTFESSVRKAVAEGRAVPLANLVERNCASLKLIERQCAWSYVDYLVWYDAKAFKTVLFRALEYQLPTRDAIKEAYGFSLPQLQEKWEAWVKLEYSVKDRKGPLTHTPRDPSKK